MLSYVLFQNSGASSYSDVKNTVFYFIYLFLKKKKEKNEILCFNNVFKRFINLKKLAVRLVGGSNI